MEPSKWGIGEWIAYGFGGFILLIIAVALVAAVVMVFNKRPAARQQNAAAGAQPQPGAGQVGAQHAAGNRQMDLPNGGIILKFAVGIIAVILIIWGVTKMFGAEIPTGTALKWGGLVLFALVGAYMLARVKGFWAKVFGLLLISPILLTVWSGPEEGERFANNLGKTVGGVADGVGEAGESLSELTVPETLRTKGEIELGQNEEKQVMLTSEPREIAYATVGQCFGGDPIDKIGFRKVAPGKGEVWSKSGERQFTLFTRPHGTCP